MKFLVPLVFAFAGVGAGVGAGVMLRPTPDAADAHGAEGQHGAPVANAAASAGGEAHGKAKSHGKADSHGASKGSADGYGAGSAEYVDLRNQFIIPILAGSRVDSFVVLDLDLEVAMGSSETIHRVEPKIRDAFLTVLFDHANAGGFEGAFTSSGAMEILRRALREAGQKAVGGELLTDVLIASIVRQDV